MKKILILLVYCFTVLSVFAQPRPAPKPVAAPVAKKPSGPSPYVLKKDYDSLSTSLRAQIKSLQGTLGAMRGTIGSKDKEIESLSQQMKQVEEVLNSTNFKISLTSDSLTKTRTSIEEVQTESREGISTLQSKNESLTTQVMLLWALSIAGLLLAAFAWISGKNQLKAAESAQLVRLAAMERSLLENKNAIDEQLKNLESKLANEGRNAQHYTDRQTTVLKDNLQNMNDFVNGLKDDVQAISNEVQGLKQK